jgi:thioredoxin reductase
MPRIETLPEGYDALVVGGGPAGLSAALWLGRYRRRTILVDAGEPRNRFVERGHGYFPHDDFDPNALLAQGRDALARYPSVELRTGRVSDVERTDDGFAALVDDDTVTARAVVLATGVVDVFPDIANLELHYGTSVFTCPACDGWETRGTDAVVIGWSEDIVGFALTLLNWARTVTIVTEAHHLDADVRQRDRLRARGISVLEDDAIEFVGERGDLRGIVLRTRGFLPCQSAFFSIDTHPANAFAKKLGCEISEEGCVTTDWDEQTSVPFVYAAGDITPGPQLVQIAAAEGAAAGIACAKALGLPRSIATSEA